MQDLLKKLEALSLKKDGISMHFRKGASKAALAKAEKTMGIKFPADFAEYLLLHDGQDDDDDAPSWRLASLEEIVERWKEERDDEENYPEENKGFILKDKVLNRSRCAQWIPFLGAPNWDQDIVYIDLAPGPKGVSGQIIGLVTECDYGLHAKSFTDFLKQWIKNKKPY